MAKPELGMKRICVACAARFYDLTKTPAICPKCGAEQPVETPRVRRPAAPVVDDKRAKKPAPAPGTEEADIDVEDVEDVDDDDVMEDASDLEDDDDSIGADIEVNPDSDEER